MSQKQVIKLQPKPQCLLCGQFGHLSEDCSDLRSQTLYFKQSGIGGTRTLRCYRCGIEGHFTTECRRPLRCDKCGLTGHKQNQCLVQVCYRCGDRSHEEAFCELDRSVCCRDCGTVGHIAAACPKDPCRYCGIRGHHPAMCDRHQQRKSRAIKRLDQRQRDMEAFVVEKSHSKFLSLARSNADAGAANFNTKASPDLFSPSARLPPLLPATAVKLAVVHPFPSTPGKSKKPQRLVSPSAFRETDDEDDDGDWSSPCEQKDLFHTPPTPITLTTTSSSTAATISTSNSTNTNSTIAATIISTTTTATTTSTTTISSSSSTRSGAAGALAVAGRKSLLGAFPLSLTSASTYTSSEDTASGRDSPSPLSASASFATPHSALSRISSRPTCRTSSSCSSSSSCTSSPSLSTSEEQPEVCRAVSSGSERTSGAVKPLKRRLPPPPFKSSSIRLAQDETELQMGGLQSQMCELRPQAQDTPSSPKRLRLRNP